MHQPLIYKATQERELITQAINYLERGFSIAMLTLIDIEGNAPYPVGSQVLVRDDGKFIGQITGGCAEQALVEQALSVIASGVNTVERYGVNSRFFDIQLPCGSGLDIEFDVESNLAFYKGISQALKQRKAVEVSSVKTYYPTSRLLIFGQGPIISHLINFATEAGFEVFLFSHDNGSSYSLNNYCDQFSGLVSLFHEHDLEIDILTSVLSSKLFYIGALGSRRTHAARLDKLTLCGVSKHDLDRIHGPIGLDIGAITPSQIAVSIVAQVIASMNANGK